MKRKLDVVPSGERVCTTNAGQEWWSSNPRLRRFTEIWVEERRRQLGTGEVGR
jgi:hypothetical protein